MELPDDSLLMTRRCLGDVVQVNRAASRQQGRVAGTAGPFAKKTQGFAILSERGDSFQRRNDLQPNTTQLRDERRIGHRIVLGMCYFNATSE